MHRLLATAPLCLALAACATAVPDKPTVCDGRHRRAANPNGSVLVPAGPALVSPVKPRSPHAGDRRSFAPCGDSQ